MNKWTIYTNVNTEKSPIMAYLPLRPPGRTDWRESRSAGAKNAFFIFHVPTANNSNFANEPRGQIPTNGLPPPALPYFGLTHTSCWRLPVVMSWRQHTSSTQHHDNKQPTPFRFRLSFGRVSVYHRYPEYPTSTPGDTRSPGVAGVDHGVFPYWTLNCARPYMILFWLIQKKFISLHREKK